jgi:hypothetical protein
MEDDVFNVHLVIMFVHVLIHIVVHVVNLNDHHAEVCQTKYHVNIYNICVFQGMTSAVIPTAAPPSSGSACSSNLCSNRGICQQTGYGTGIQCYCSTGWSGSRCQYSKLYF